MATTIIGKVGITPQGEWSASRADYNRLDWVTHGVSSYMVIFKGGNVPAGTPVTDTTYWQETAKGVDASDLAKTGGSNKTIADIYGGTEIPTLIEQKPIVDLSVMTLTGGASNLGNFNSYPFNYSYPYKKLRVRVPISQDVTVLKLSSDGVTITELQVFAAVLGLNEFTLTTPIQLLDGETLGIKGSGQSFYYVDGDVGSRNKNSSGNWVNSTITFSYSLIYEVPAVEMQYDTLNKISTAIELVEAETAKKTELEEETANRQAAISDLFGGTLTPSDFEQKPSASFSGMTSAGGANNLGCFNNFPFIANEPILSVSVRSFAAQTITIIKLEADGTTILTLESHAVPVGESVITLTTPVILLDGEKLGLDLGAVNMYYTASADVGSRNKSSTGSWANASAITWAYGLKYSIQPDVLEYDTVKKLNDKVVELSNEDVVTPYADRPAGGIEKFQVQVNCTYPNYTNTGVTVSDTEVVNPDDAAISLPTTYAKSGEPTRLVVYCHGAGSRVNAAANNLSSTRLAYLLAKGYACLDVNGLPAAIWEEGEEANKCAGMGGQIALQCYIKAYEYVINKYNLRKDGVFLLGTSMGGLTSGNLLANTRIPFMAQCLEAPITHLYEQAWLKPWFPGAKGTRFQLAKYYNFANYQTFDFANTGGLSTADFNAALEVYWQANKHKVLGFDPASFQAYTIGSLKSKPHKVPLLIIHSQYDSTSLIVNSQNYVNYIKNGGGNAQLRTIDDGNVYSNQHAPMSFTNDVTDAEGVTTKAAVREMYLFFKRFD